LQHTAATIVASRYENLSRPPLLNWLFGGVMSVPFQLVDLVSQGPAVQRHLHGRPLPDKLEWLAARGRLFAHRRLPGFAQTYTFESDVGLSCTFFMREEQIVFVGDNTTFTVSE
jgi:hypothetical protein